MKIIALVLTFAAQSAMAASPPPMLSPFPSTVPGITINNTHLVANGESKILRGMRPTSAADVNQLTDAGVSQILIFRNDVKGEDSIAKELSLLKANPKIKAIFEVPFKWKDIRSFKMACEQSIQALRILKNSLNTKNANIFFHCTFGEDRTGFLAGILLMLKNGRGPEDVFQNEMCSNGYADGAKARRTDIKPPEVVNLIHENITVVFAQMAALIESGRLTMNNLDESVCGHLPMVDQNQFRCQQPRVDEAGERAAPIIR